MIDKYICKENEIERTIADTLDYYNTQLDHVIDINNKMQQNESTYTYKHTLGFNHKIHIHYRITFSKVLTRIL